MRKLHPDKAWMGFTVTLRQGQILFINGWVVLACGVSARGLHPWWHVKIVMEHSRWQVAGTNESCE